MKLAIMQPYFFPYIGYFQAIAAVDKYILYDNLTFILQSWMNRNRLVQKNGTPFNIIVPLINKSSNTLIRDTKVDNSKPWNVKLLKTVLLTYKGAAFFDEIFSLLESILSIKYDTIHELNSNTIIPVARYLDIKTDIVTDNTNYLELETKLNYYDDYSIFPELQLTKPIKKVARAIEMCRNENSNIFINAIGGQELYSKDEFRQYGIDLCFVKTNEIFYKQFSETFVPNLSIIDVLMHNGKEGTKKLLDEYTLI